MKNTKKISLVLLSLIMVLLLFACGKCKHADENKDGICDKCEEVLEVVVQDVWLVEDGVASFQFVVSSDLETESNKALETLIRDLKKLGVTVEKVSESAESVKDVEVLVGTVKTRGEQYLFDKYSLGSKVIKIVDSKVLITAGSDRELASAIEEFGEDILGLAGNPDELVNVVMTKEQVVEEIQSDYRITALKVNGVDMRGYTIAADTTVLYHNYAAKKLQSTIYEKTGYWLEIVTPDRADKSIIIKGVAKADTVPEGFKASVNDKNQLVIETAYDNMLERAIGDFLTAKVTSVTGEVNLTGSFVRTVSSLTYEEFGAVGDGVTNDFEAIYKTHDKANEGGQKVYGTPGKTYYIEAPLINNQAVDIVIKTDTDWKGAKFIIDDRKISQTDSTKAWGTVDIRIASDYAARELSKAQNEAAFNALVAQGLNPDTRKIDVKALLGEEYAKNPYPVMLTISNTSHTIFRRRGYDSYTGMGMIDIVLLDKDGNIDPDTHFMWDYHDVTHITIRRVDDEPIIVQNAEFTTRASQFNCIFVNKNGQKDDYAPYLNRGLSVGRSNTTIRNIKHYVTDEIQWKDYVNEDNTIKFVGSTYRGFYRTGGCTDVTYENCVMTGRRCYLRPNGGGTGGTYDLTCGKANRVTFKNCTQSNFWVTVDPDTGDIKAAKKGDVGAVLGMGYYPGTDFRVILDANVASGKTTGVSMHWGVANTSFSKNVAYIDSTLSRFDAHEGIYNGKIIGSTVQTVALTGGGNFHIENTTIFPDDENPRAFGVRADYGSSFMGKITAKNLSIIAPAKDENGNWVKHYIMQRDKYTNWYYGYIVTVPSMTLSDIVFYDMDNYDQETDTYAQVPSSVPVYLYGSTTIKADTTHHLSTHSVTNDKNLWPIYSVEDKDGDGYIDVPDIDGDGEFDNTTWKFQETKDKLNEAGLNAYQKGYTHEGSAVNLNVVEPPEYVKILSNKGGYKYWVRDTSTLSDDPDSRVSNGGYHGVAENWKGFYGSTKFYYGPGENDYYQGPPKQNEKNPDENVYIFG